MQQISQTLLCGLFIDAVKRTAARIKLRGMSVGSACDCERAAQYMLPRTTAVCVKVTHSISLTLPSVFAQRYSQPHEGSLPAPLPPPDHTLRLAAGLPARLSVCLSVCLSFYLSVCLSNCLSRYLSVCQNHCSLRPLCVCLKPKIFTASELTVVSAGGWVRTQRVDHGLDACMSVCICTCVCVC